MPQTVSEIAENELVARIAAILGPTRTPDVLLGLGDDSAVIRAARGAVTVSTDVLVEGHHFRTHWSTPEQIGWRAAVQNFADAAAMGARPTSIVVALVIPPSVEVAWVDGFARGIANACTRYGVAAVGGDIAAGEAIVAAVTVLGETAGAAPTTRSGARPGDVVALAGRQGWSAAGLAVLGRVLPSSSAPARPDTNALPAQVAAVVEAFRAPRPAIAAGIAAGGYARAMMDVSDGLLRDADRLAGASGVQIDFDDPLVTSPYDAGILLPVARYLGATETEALGQVREWLLTGGEDHGMLAAFDPGAVPESFRLIGRVRERSSEQTVTIAGQGWQGATGWDHFAG